MIEIESSEKNKNPTSLSVHVLILDSFAGWSDHMAMIDVERLGLVHHQPSSCENLLPFPKPGLLTSIRGSLSFH